jgi:hypothetical protein
LEYLSNLLLRKQEIEEALATISEYNIYPFSEFSLYDQNSLINPAEMYEKEKKAGMTELLAIELEKINQAIEQHQNAIYGNYDQNNQTIEPDGSQW